VLFIGQYPIQCSAQVLPQQIDLGVAHCKRTGRIENRDRSELAGIGYLRSRGCALLPIFGLVLTWRCLHRP
jgi:hypothetical protein